MEKQTPLFSFNDVSVHSAGFDRVVNIDWEVRRGEHWVVAGPTGSGKSSIAEALAGEAHFTGDIEYGFGKNLSDPTRKTALVSFLLHKQFAAQTSGYSQARWYAGEEDSTLTASEILGLEGQELTPVQREWILSVSASMGIGGLLERQALHLSTGELRRLLIARALLLSPALLILDEPFLGLDAQCRGELSAALSALIRSSKKSNGLPHVLLLTARPDELPAGMTHCLFVRNGRRVGECKLGSTEAARLRNRTFRSSPRVKLPEMSARRKSAKSIVELRNVAIRAGGTSILRDINWIVKRGQCWAVLGPNGAGKTTLLSLLTGDHPQSFSQHVAMFGKLRGEHATRELKARIGHASPDIALHYDGHTGALDFVCTGFFETLGLYEHATRAQEKKALAWLEFFGLRKFAAHPFRLLSDGQQRLVLIARALVKSPELLILDEPCQGLDRAASERVRVALNTASGNGATLIVVSHYLEELPRGVTHTLKLTKDQKPLISRL